MMTVRRTPSQSLDRPYAAKLSPEVQWYLESRGYVLEDWQQPLWRTREPRDVPGAFFDPERVDRVIESMRVLRHTQGKWAGKPMVPDAWQVAFVIAPVFGWVRENSDGLAVRIVRQAWVEVPRKNGKTTLSSGLGLYLCFADGERGSQVYAAAGSKDQAMLAYTPAKLVAQSSPEFRAAGIDAQQRMIVRPLDGSYFKAVASVGDLLQGTNPNGYIVDEMHVHKTLDVIEALETGTGARDQPLGLVITTADAGKRNSPYAVRRDLVEKVCKGIVEDPSMYGVIFAAPKSADPFVESTWKRANPGYGVSPTAEYMRAAAQKAKNSPSDLAAFLRLNLNVRTKQETKFISMRAWDANRVESLREESLTGRQCYGGLDLASVSDLSALCWLFPETGGRFSALWRFWTPEDNLEDLDKRTAGMASVWADAGFLTTTPGNVQDYDYIREQIRADMDRFRVLSIGYDPWNSMQLINDLVDFGANMVKVRQGFGSMSGPLKQVQRLTMSGLRGAPGIAHMNPVMDWCVDNLSVATDPAGNVKPDKANSGEKIDGVAALVTAMSEAMSEELVQSAYGDGHGLIIA